MARLSFTVLLVLPQVLALTKACDPFFGNGFDPNHERFQSRIFKGKRLFVDELIPTFSSRAAFTSLECLDICLRFDHCVSFDFLSSTESTCRIHRAVQGTMFIVEEKDWTHFNMSDVYLRQVRRVINVCRWLPLNTLSLTALKTNK